MFEEHNELHELPATANLRYFRDELGVEWYCTQEQLESGQGYRACTPGESIMYDRSFGG